MTWDGASIQRQVEGNGVKIFGGDDTEEGNSWNVKIIHSFFKKENL